jgi:WD40 repeat protein
VLRRTFLEKSNQRAALSQATLRSYALPRLREDDGGHKDWVYCLQALPDGRIVSGSYDKTLRIWSKDSSGRWQSEVLKGHESYVFCLQALPDGRIVSGSYDKTLRIWSKDSSGRWQSEVLEGHTHCVSCLQALPDGRIVSGSGDETLRIWDGELVGPGA